MSATCLQLPCFWLAFFLRTRPLELKYAVDWPGIHLSGGFTLDVGPALGSYLSSSASGTYGGLNGEFNVNWNQVQFNAQANFAELKFIWDQGYTSYAVSPAYVGRPLPWASANEAWEDLILKGASDGVHISSVPEPSAFALVVGLPVLIIFRRTAILEKEQKPHEDNSR